MACIMCNRTEKFTTPCRYCGEKGPEATKTVKHIGLNLETLEALKPTVQKIVDGLKAKDRVPGFLTFPMFLAKVLVEADYTLLEKLENEAGEKYANDWLCDVMVLSGRYQRDGDSVFPVG